MSFFVSPGGVDFPLGARPWVMQLGSCTASSAGAPLEAFWAGFDAAVAGRGAADDWEGAGAGDGGVSRGSGGSDGRGGSGGRLSCAPAGADSASASHPTRLALTTATLRLPFRRPPLLPCRIPIDSAYTPNGER